MICLCVVWLYSCICICTCVLVYLCISGLWSPMMCQVWSTASIAMFKFDTTSQVFIKYLHTSKFAWELFDNWETFEEKNLAAAFWILFQFSFCQQQRREPGEKVCASWKLYLYSNSCICLEKEMVFVLKTELYLCLESTWLVCTYLTWLPRLVSLCWWMLM